MNSQDNARRWASPLRENESTMPRGTVWRPDEKILSDMRKICSPLPLLLSLASSFAASGGCKLKSAFKSNRIGMWLHCEMWLLGHLEWYSMRRLMKGPIRNCTWWINVFCVKLGKWLRPNLFLPQVFCTKMHNVEFNLIDIWHVQESSFLFQCKWYGNGVEAKQHFYGL